MAKKQTRRSISVSRTTYERLKAFCEANNVSMSQLVETQVNGFLGADGAPEVPRSEAPRPAAPTPPCCTSARTTPTPSARARWWRACGSRAWARWPRA